MAIPINLNMFKELGKGTFGVTYLAKNPSNQLYAIKAIDVAMAAKNGVDINQIIAEVEALKTLSANPRCYPLIACYYDAIRQPFNGRDTIFIVSEYVDGPDLERILDGRRNLGNAYTANELWNYMYQLISGLNFIHKMGFAHRDIKPTNIILDANTNRLKYIDFGLACTVNCDEPFVGSPLWIPPEDYTNHIDRNLATAQAHDVWSLGVVLYEMANLRLPFQGDLNTADVKTFSQILTKPLIPSRYHNRVRPQRNNLINFIINSMLTQDIRTRPKIGEVLEYMENDIRARNSFNL